MKYNFVFDNEFLGNSRFYLSAEEVSLVRVIVNGGHNVMLRGYRPERIVRAIKAIVSDTVHIEDPHFDVSLEKFCGGGADLKKGCVSLAHNGILIMNNINKFKVSVIQMTAVPMTTGSIILSRGGETVQYPSAFQLIATIGSEAYSNSIDSITKYCEIDYYCRKTNCCSVISLSELKETIQFDWKSHLANNPFTYKNQEVDSVDLLNFTTQAKELYKGEITETFVRPLMIAKVARTVADMNYHTSIRTTDLETARRLFTPQFPV